jgi:hypothetical protein
LEEEKKNERAEEVGEEAHYGCMQYGSGGGGGDRKVVMQQQQQYVRSFDVYFFLLACAHARPRTARVIGGLDSSDIFCNCDYKHFLA